ncbi:MAG: hypothetical protein C0502_04870 [Opitutus sp.]|nr:hypothetical protein [Opitutus sp.]
MLVDASVLAVQSGVRKLRPAPVRKSRGATLRPGAETPLWLALSDKARPLLRRRGARTLLARELGVHCSRITEYFLKQNAMPDAERTIQLMIWLAREQRMRGERPKRKTPYYGI